MIRFTADRAVYIRNHAWLAALGMVAAMAILWLVGNPHIWTGAPAGLAAILLRGWYLASEELGVVWTIDNGVLSGPAERKVDLTDLETVRSLGSFVQVITRDGDKYLIKYQADPSGAVNQIKTAQLSGPS